MTGLIHIYTGDGKGKTSAAAGLAVRFAGHGGKVLFCQLLKDGSSGELCVLRGIPQVTVRCCERHFGFSFQMNDDERREAADFYSAILREALAQAKEGSYGLLILDEAVGAYNLGFIPRGELLDFLKNKPQELEVVLTGRDPAPELLELADYVSEIKKVRHPFDAGIPARDGIEQ